MKQKNNNKINKQNRRNKARQSAGFTPRKDKLAANNSSRPFKHVSRWIMSLDVVLKQHNGYTADGGKVCSYATQRQRKDVLWQGFNTLRKLGYKLNHVAGIKGKHISVLTKHWQELGLSASTVQNRLSIFRTFAGWVGKKGMIRELEYYLGEEHGLKRSYVAVKDRSWSGQGVDTTEKIKDVRTANMRVGDALALQLAFGIRSKESLLLKPHLADKGKVLLIDPGTKGGKVRYLTIDHPVQRLLLDSVKSYVGLNESLVPPEKSYKQFRNAYYYELRKQGICREQGITPHGLRHEHLQNLYRAITGNEPPVTGGNLHESNKELDKHARELVAQCAGHGRESISSAYIGGKQGQSAEKLES